MKLQALAHVGHHESYYLGKDHPSKNKVASGGDQLTCECQTAAMHHMIDGQRHTKEPSSATKTPVRGLALYYVEGQFHLFKNFAFLNCYYTCLTSVSVNSLPHIIKQAINAAETWE